MMVARLPSRYAKSVFFDRPHPKHFILTTFVEQMSSGSAVPESTHGKRITRTDDLRRLVLWWINNGSNR